jgi:hypothetical protein
MGFKPAAFGLLAGDSGKEILENTIGSTSIAGKLYMDDKKKREEEAAKAAAASQPAGTQAVAGQGMKKGGKVSSASSRADGIAQRGKTRGKMY